MPKISALPLTGSSTADDYIVSNNSGETLTSKIQLKNVVGLTQGTGSNTIKSADYLTSVPNHTDGADSVIIGSGNSGYTGADRNVIIGFNSFTNSVDGVYIGNNAKDQGSGRDRAVVIGLNSEAYQQEAVQIGYDNAGVSQTVGIGVNNRPIGSSCIGLGYSNVVAGNEGICIGYDNFEDRPWSLALGYQNYVDGQYDIAIGSENRTDSNVPGKIAIGYSNLVDTAEKQIVIGYNNSSQSTGNVILSNGAASLNTTSPWNVYIGSSGNTQINTSVKTGNGWWNTFDNTTSFGMNYCHFLGGSGNTTNLGGGAMENNIFLGLRGRTIVAGSTNTTYTENHHVFRQQSFATTGFTDSGNCYFDVNNNHYVNITATGGTYDISSFTNPEGPSKQVVLYIEYFSGATINFTDATGFINWRWDRNTYGGSAPVFSATTAGIPSRSIITIATWDNEDFFEVSRSMNME